MSIEAASIGPVHGPAAKAASWQWVCGRRDRVPLITVIESPSSPACTLAVTIPDKWATVEVTTKGGDVSVERVVEGSLSVSSGGGDVSLKDVRAFDAFVDTMSPQRCGQLKAGELSASELMLSTGHGRMDIKRLVGSRVRADTHDASLSVRALYAEQVQLSTGGGPIAIGQLDCSGEATLTTRGGRVDIEGLDGNCSIATEGGNVEVHLHRKVGSVQVSSGGGRVYLAVSPSALACISVRNAAAIRSDQEFLPDERTGDPTAHFRPREDSSGPTGRLALQPEGRVVVDAGGGVVEVVRLGWAEALKAKLAKARA